MTAYLGIAAASFGLAMAASPLLQMARILKRRHSGDVSVMYLTIICAGAAMWTAYAVSSRNLVLFIPNVVGVMTNLVTIMVVLRFRHESDTAPEGT